MQSVKNINKKFSGFLSKRECKCDQMNASGTVLTVAQCRATVPNKAPILLMRMQAERS